MIENLFLIAEHVGDNVCSETNILKALRFVGYLLYVVKMLVPVIVIGFGILDLYKIVIEGEQSGFSKQVKSLLFRIFIGITIFFIPTILLAIINGLEGFDAISTDYDACSKCLLDPFKCEIK